MLRPWLFVGFTGHRKLANEALIATAIQQALDDIATRTGAPLAAVSSVASGADTLFAREVIHRQMPWQALLPLPRAEFAQDFAPEQWAEVEYLLRAATEVEADDTPTETTLGRDDCYLECGVRTVDASDVLIAVWDGAAAAGKGGTGDVVAHARSQGRPVIWIQAESGEIRWENPSALPRIDGEGPQSVRPDSAEGGLQALVALRDHHDHMAMHHAPEARDLLTKVILLHLVATGLALLGPILGLWIVIALGLVALKIGMLIYADRLHHRRQHSHQIWLRSRLVAELGRSMIGAWFVPYAARVHRAVAVPGFGRWQRSLALWRRFAAPAEQSLEEVKAHYGKERVSDQLAYFRRHLRRAEGRHHRAHAVATWATWSAIVCGLVVLAVQVPHLWHLLHGAAEASEGEHPQWEKIVKWLSLVLPLLSAAVLSWSAANDYGRRVIRNQEMVQFLAQAEERLARVTTWGGLERIAAEVEQLLMLEILEWHSVARFGGEGH